MKRPLMWLCILGIGIMYILNGLAGYFFPPPDLAGEVTVLGRLNKKEYKNDYSILYLKDCHLQSSNSFNSGILRNQSDYNKTIKGIICYLDESCSFEEFPLYPGATVRLEGKITVLDGATNPGEFDRRKYYHAKGYDYLILGGRVTNVSGGFPVLDIFYRLKEKGGERILNVMGEEYGGILLAILFGDKNHLSQDTKDLFAEGGISHILAISGLHISLIGTFLYAVLNRKPLPVFVSFLLTLFFLFGYGYTVGLAPSVFRAIFMFSYRCLSKIRKKSYDALTALMLSGFLTCLVYPDMVSETSFLLSYLACVGIYCVFPCFLPFKNRGGRWWDTWLIGLSVFISTLPVSILSFHQVSLGGFLLNLYALPAMPVLFTLGFAVFFTAGIFPEMSFAAALVCRAILFVLSHGAETISGLPFMVFYVKSPGIVRVIVYTTLVVAFAVFANSFRRKMKLEYYRLVNREEEAAEKRFDKSGFEKEHKVFKLIQNIYYILAFSAVFLLCLFLISEPKKSTVTFLDVGQGDGIFIRTEKGDVYMIDGGSTSKKNTGENILLPYLKYEGEREVDFWLLTHKDRDHVSGFEEILAGDDVTIRRIGVPAKLREDFRDILEFAAEKGIEMVYLEAGDVITGKGKYSFTVVSPDLYEYYADANEASLAVLFREGTFTAAFMGDSGRKAEEAMILTMREYGLENLQILKCAHHGSEINANTEEFFGSVNPGLCIFSCGADNPYGHPHNSVLKRVKAVNSRIYRTDRDGAVVVSGKKRRVRTKN